MDETAPLATRHSGTRAVIDRTVMVPVLVSFAGTVEVMVNVDPADNRRDAPDWPSVRTALAYVTPEGFTVDEITDWEVLPS